MKEQTRDRIAIAWAMFGASTLGVIFMLGSSPKITGNVAKVYEVTSSVYSIITPIIGLFFLGLFIYGMWVGKFNYGKR